MRPPSQFTLACTQVGGDLAGNSNPPPTDAASHRIAPTTAVCDVGSAMRPIARTSMDALVRR